MSLEKLTDKILKEAETEAAAIIRDAEADVSGVEKKLEEEKEKISGQINRKASQLADERHRNILTNARIEARNQELSQMQRILDSVFEKGFDKLSSLPKAEYTALMKKMILSAGLTDVEIMRGKKDGAVFGKDLVTELSKSKIKATISEKEAPFDHGFLLSSGELTMDFSLESILANMREELIVSLKHDLFGE